MRKLSIVVAALATLCLALAPGAEAASADLVGQVQQQLTQTGGTLPTDPNDPNLTTIANQIAQGGLAATTDPNAILGVLQALATHYTNVDAEAVAEILAAGLTADMINDASTAPRTSDYENALQTLAGTLSPDATPTGTQLAPLTSALKSLGAGSALQPYLNTLADNINQVGGGVVPPELLNQLTAVLRLIGSTADACLNNDPSCPLAAVLKALVPAATTRASGGSGTPSTTPVAPAVTLPAVTPFTLTLRVAKVKLARNRRSAAVTLRSSAPAALLPVGFAVTYKNKAAAKPVLFNLPTGRYVTRKVTLKRAITKTLKKKGGTLKVTPAFNIPGITSIPSLTINQLAKSVKVRKPHATKRSRR
jgi:hypothetical protein